MLELRGNRKINMRWRMNEKIVNDEKILNKAQDLLNEFFKINMAQETDMSDMGRK